MSRILEVRDLSKSFGGIHAVNNVNFSVDRGELLRAYYRQATQGRLAQGRGPHVPDNGHLSIHDGCGECADGLDITPQETVVDTTVRHAIVSRRSDEPA